MPSWPARRLKAMGPVAAERSCAGCILALLVFAVVAVCVITAVARDVVGSEMSMPYVFAVVGLANLGIGCCVGGVLRMRRALAQRLERIREAERGSAPRCLRKEAIDAICPVAPIEAQADEDGDEDGDEADLCAVCLAAKLGGELGRRLPCGHSFHAACIDEWWLGRQALELRCPLCRERLPNPGDASV
mmetsp:Transcript_9315/g.25643  ORF Transcript_9315/g.25643 Transcript_9315/m.25643 type:complete len:189 (-) Transcript_9315:320-886(-)